MVIFVRKGIDMPRWSIQGLDETNLRKLYLEQKLSFRKIGKITNHDPLTVSKHIKKYKIPIRSHSEIMKGREFETSLSKTLTKEVLEDLYIKKWLSANEIGKMFGCTPDAVVLRAHRYGIPIRYSRIKRMDKAILEDLYIGKQWSTIKIARYFKAHDETIRKALIRHEIPIRSKSQAGKLRIMTPEHLARLREGARQMNLGKIGPKHHAWKGGRYVNSYGYVIRRIDGKTYLEHRYVMQQHLGRKLEPYEEVNHINGIKTDNSVQNLEVIYSEHKHKDHLRRQLQKQK